MQRREINSGISVRGYLRAEKAWGGLAANTDRPESASIIRSTSAAAGSGVPSDSMLRSPPPTKANFGRFPPMYPPACQPQTISLTSLPVVYDVDGISAWTNNDGRQSARWGRDSRPLRE